MSGRFPTDQPIVIAAFEGWNDAGEAATAVVEHLEKVWQARPLAEIGPDDYYDMQVVRPRISLNEKGVQSLTWPATRIAIAEPPFAPTRVILVRGIEPGMHWKQFCAELLDAVLGAGAGTFITMGALLADSPHSRPVPVTLMASDATLAAKLNLEPNEYEGPTGIVGVLLDAASKAGLAGLSAWAAVPHYVAAPPSPKASLALLRQLEELLDVSIPLGDLPEEARAWQIGVDELASEDDEIAEYVTALEETVDTTELPEASGEAIAREFERYLQRRDPEDPAAE
jgi:predicted ATP-grasp superfamily ATP-dependent carboligase